MPRELHVTYHEDTRPHPEEAARILIATDGSDASLRAARAALRLVDGAAPEVRLLVVLGHEHYPQVLATGADLADAGERRARADHVVQRAAEACRAALGPIGASATVGRRYGNAADEILAEIAAWHPDLVVLGRRNLRGIERMLLGSVSERVLKHSPAPVLVVP